jgi:hypothetical protein
MAIPYSAVLENSKHPHTNVMQQKGFMSKNCFVGLSSLNVSVLPLRTVMAFFLNLLMSFRIN